MDSQNESKLTIISMRGCEEVAGTVDEYLKQWRYKEGSYLLPVECPRFSSGEAKAVVKGTARGKDIYIITDIFNYGITYQMYGMTAHMSPDDHFQDLKRVISALGGKSQRITVIMPMLYEGRQHKRMQRESLDCALALQELANMDVTNIITFDAHDPRVQNSIPLNGFDNVQPTYQMIKALLREFQDIEIERGKTIIVSPDEGAMQRCIYYSSVMELELGMFYKKRDYSRIVDGKNPIEAHEFLGSNVEGMDAIIVDDMISSGESMLEVAKKLKGMGAKRIFVFATFGLFCNGLSLFDQAYEEGVISGIFTTNLTYATDELKERPWYKKVSMSKYIALLIDTLNKDKTISTLLNPYNKIETLLSKYKQSHQN